MLSFGTLPLVDFPNRAMSMVSVTVIEVEDSLADYFVLAMILYAEEKKGTSGGVNDLYIAPRYGLG
jgi:hypothetical protein